MTTHHTGLDIGYPVPPEVLKARPGRYDKRSELLTERRGFTYRKTGTPITALALNDDVGLYLDIPEGEIWVPDHCEFYVEVSAAQSWSEIKGRWFGFAPVCLNDVWQNGDPTEVNEEVFASTTNASATSFTKTWDRSNLDIYRSKLDEGCRLSIGAKIGGVANLLELKWTLIYYRVPLWDENLRALRDKYDECEAFKILTAAGPSTFLNQRNDRDW